MTRLLTSALTLCGILLGLAAVPAKAATLDVTCPGTETSTFSPGLLLTPQTVTSSLKFVFGPCQSSDPTLKSGTYAATFTATVACQSINNSFGTGFPTPIVWNNGRTSTFTFTFVTSNSLLGETVTVATGVVTDGEFKGDTATAILTFATLNLLGCLAPPGVTSRSGAVVLSFVRP